MPSIPSESKPSVKDRRSHPQTIMNGSNRLRNSLLLLCLSFPLLLLSSFNRPETTSSLHRASELPVLDIDKTLVVQRGAHYVATDEAATTVEHLYVKGEDTNVGNYVWQAGALALINRQSSNHIYCQDDRDACVEKHPIYARIVHYIPSSYMLADDIMARKRPSLLGRMQSLTKDMTRFDEPFFFVGIGTQADFHPDKIKNDFALASKIVNSPQTYSLADAAVHMLQKLQEMNTPVFFRGDFSNSVAELAGYNLGVATGCPSLMLNKNIHLGQELQNKYDAISQRINDRSIRLAVNIASAKNELRSWYFGILKRYPNSVLFAQGRDEARYFLENGIPFSRLRYYPHNVESWVRNLSTMDASIGSRIHGSMAALAAAIPLYIISPDFRVSEMAQAMAIPNTHMFDKNLQDESLDIATLFKNIQFNGDYFDRNRCRIANIYLEKLGSYGVQLAPHVLRIAKNC